MKNSAFSIGAIAQIDKVNKEHNLFNYLLDDLHPKQKQFIEYVKCLIHNKFDKRSIYKSNIKGISYRYNGISWI